MSRLVPAYSMVSRDHVAAAADTRQVAQTIALRCGQDQSASVSQALQSSHLLLRDSYGSRVGPSQPARRVISAITGFRFSAALGAP
ncbi:Hypothetical protein DHA2_154234 [Giardia duodenalis]|uniref:Uncharacterized protein n=1 Tax=Giardia intestinalis TaxID=5741 RepID=V6T7A9_GIAIN|nr:Hypothetical protein DHA2_154234 [Giardia intestinalis]